MFLWSQSTKSIQHFQVKYGQQVFAKAQQYPDFFNQQLVDPHRVIKVIKDNPNALERIFYYQYLNLCLKNAEGYPQIRIKNMREILDNKEFSFIFLPNLNKNSHTDEQFKRIGRQFLDILKNSSKKLEQLICKYPIVDQVFTLLMRSILIINKQAEEIEQFIDKLVILKVLGRVFDIQYEIYGNCIRFTESDVFAYQESSFQIYMAYIVNHQLTEFQPKYDQYNNKQMNQRKQGNKKYGFIDYINSESQKELFSNSSNSDNLSENCYAKQADKLYLKDFSKKSLSKQYQNQQRKGNFNLKLIPIPEIAEIMFDNDERNRQKSLQAQNLFNKIRLQKNLFDYPQKPLMNQSQFSQKTSQSKVNYDYLSGSTFQITNNSKYSQQFNDILYQKQLPLKNYKPESNKNDNFFPQKINSRENHKKSNTCPGSIPYQSSYLNVNVPGNNSFIPKYSHIFKERGFDFDIQKDINYTVRNPMAIDTKLIMNKNKNDVDIDKAFVAPSIQLEVTKQFTNSIILNQMPQIYSQNIRRTRDRARAYRKKLNQRY